jgi:membrane-bound metal-dependent hydrolase YbcI (DUF457 family)
VFGADPPAFLTAAVASTVPDLDRFFPGMHRKITHSVLAILVVYLFGIQYFPGLVGGFLIGYSGHILMDMITPSGVPLLWLLSKRFRLPITQTGRASVEGVTSFPETPFSHGLKHRRATTRSDQ